MRGAEARQASGRSVGALILMLVLAHGCALADPRPQPDRDRGAPLISDPVLGRVGAELDLLEVPQAEDRRCLESSGELYGTWHAEVACHRSVRVRSLALRPRSRLEEPEWTVFVDRIEFPSQRAADRAASAILRRLPRPLPSEMVYVGPEFTWCWQTVSFAGTVFYVARTPCWGNPDQHERVSRSLLSFGEPTGEGPIGVRGYHSGFGDVVLKSPE